MAGSSSVVSMSLAIVPAGGETITVTAPDGGESWAINSSQNITWNATFTITDVKIELQRTVAGAWETIIASTTNDGSYPWTVTGPTTSEATVKVSKVGDAGVYDTSDDIFSIVGGGGGPSNWPGIDDVVPNVISNDAAVVVAVIGSNFDSSVGVKLNTTIMHQVEWQDDHHLKFTVPARFPIGVYSLTVYDSYGRYGVWGSWVWVVSGPVENQLPPGIPKPVPVEPKPGEPAVPAQPINLYYAAQLVRQSPVCQSPCPATVQLTVGETITLLAEFKNTGTLPWYNFGKNPTRLGTSNPRDRLSVFKPLFGWVLKNRPANVTRAGYNAGGKQTVNPGETGRFTFKIKAPNKPGKYTEVFQTVVEFHQWMQSTVDWEITVVPKPAKIPAVKKPATSKPTGGQTLPMPNLPQGPAEFYDTTEGWLRAFTNFFSRLVGGLVSGIKR